MEKKHKTVVEQSDFHFKRVIIGGYDKIDVMNQFKQLNEKYQELLDSQETYYKKLIDELEEKYSNLINNKIANITMGTIARANRTVRKPKKDSGKSYGL